MEGRILFAIALVSLISLSFAAPQDGGSSVEARKTKKSHPGCYIYWFLDGCPLGSMFGSDPFKIYPWKKFCRKYSGLEETKQCKEIRKKQEEELLESIEEMNVEEEEEIVEEETMDEDDEAFDMEVSPRQPKDLTDRQKRKMCRTSKRFFRRNRKRCEALLKKLRPKRDDKSVLERSNKMNCKMSKKFYKRNKRNCQALLKRTRREVGGGTGAAAQSVFPGHPGCGAFWFLPGCPLGVVAVDPMNSYPWAELCKFEALREHARCVPALRQYY